jgi:hypothetical protein
MEAALVKHARFNSSFSRQTRSGSTQLSFSGLDILPDREEWEAEYHFEMLMLDG